MEQSPSWEAEIHLASQEIPLPFTEPEGSLPCWQQPTIDPYYAPDESNPQLPTLFL